MAKNETESRFTIKAIDKTQRVLRGIRRGFNDTATKVRNSLAIATAAILLFASGGLSAADSLAKISDQSQLATENVQAYRLAMELAGGSSQGLDKSIVQMNKNIGIAVRDGGSLERVFESLGLRASDLAALGTDEAFEQIGEAISKLPTAAQKSAAALQIFGRQGREMLTLFKDGRAGIDAAREDIEALGLAMSRVDAAKVEIANDQLTRLNQVSRGASQILAAELAPIIDDIASRFLNSAKEAGGLQMQIEKAVTVGVKGIAYLGNAIKGWEIIVKAGRAAFAGLFEYILKGFGNVIRGFELMIGKVVKGTNDLIISINRATGGVTDMNIIRFDGFELDDKVREIAEGFELGRKALTDELTTALAEPLPTELVDNWLAEIREKTETAAEEIARSSADKIAQGSGIDVGELSFGLKQDPFSSLQSSLGFDRQFLPEAQNEFQDLEQQEIRLREQYERQREIILEAERITQDQRLELMEEAERRFLARQAIFQEERGNMLISSGQATFDSMLGMTKDFAGEQSGLYQGMFAASKAFALADSIVSIQQGIANALSLPFPASIAAAATVAAQAAGVISTISSTALSFEGGGYTGGGSRSGGLDGKGGFMAMLHPQERVIDEYKGQRSGKDEKVVIIVNNNGDAQASVRERRTAQGREIEVLIEKIDERLAGNARDGRGKLTKALRSSYGLKHNGVTA